MDVQTFDFGDISRDSAIILSCLPPPTISSSSNIRSFTLFHPRHWNRDRHCPRNPGIKKSHEWRPRTPLPAQKIYSLSR